MVGRITAIAIAIVVALALYGVRSGMVRVPDHLNPWATLDLRATPNFLTRYKLARLSQDPGLCRAVLATSGIRFEALDDQITGTGCGFHNAVRIDRTSAAVSEPFALSCRAAVSLALWEHHVLQPSAQRLLGQRVARIDHFGSYSCRNVYGRSNATRSQHATAEAFDIAGFVLADGRRLRVLKDWSGPSPDAEFLRTVRSGACRFFDGVLSPDYNEAHRDHFHFDRSPRQICR